MSEKVDPDDVVAALHEHPEPVATAADLAEQLPCGDRTVLNRLDVLEAAGRVERKEAGARAVVWWLPGTRKPRPDAPERERRLAPDQADLAESVDHDPETPEEPAEDGREEGIAEYGLPELISDLDLPGSGETLEERRDAVRVCVEYLQARGTAQKSDFIEDVYPERPARYESSGGWWNAIGNQGLDELAEQSEAISDPGGEGAHKWRWTGDGGGR